MSNDGEGGCCARCHFRWEERKVLSLLPSWLAADLLREHAQILALPLFEQPRALRLHGKLEEIRLRPFVGVTISPQLYRELVAQHADH